LHGADTAGDGFLVAFKSPTAGVRCANRIGGVPVFDIGEQAGQVCIVSHRFRTAKL
jgi:hypothetical protein